MNYLDAGSIPAISTKPIIISNDIEIERERGRENGSFPVVEVLEPQGSKEERSDDVKFPPSPRIFHFDSHFRIIYNNCDCISLIINRKYIEKTKSFRINGQIKSPKVMVIDENGTQLGLLMLGEALKISYDKGLDLVEVSPNLNPPVCKIMDYGKYVYKITKQKRKHSAKQKKIELKTIRLSSRIDTHDLEFKAKNAVRFMKKGNKVKIEMILRGREKAHESFAREKMDKFLEAVYDISKTSSETVKKEIVKEQNVTKTPQGFIAIIEYKRS